MSREWKEVADEVHLKHCRFCGKKIEKPFFYGGNVFCSDECKESFTRTGRSDS